GRIDKAERTLAELDSASFPPASRTAHELVVAGIAIRRLRTKAARVALARATRAARQARIPALTAEVESAHLVLNTPAARLIASGGGRVLRLEEVEAVLASNAFVVDACRHVGRHASTVVALATRPVLAPPVEEEHAWVLAFLADGESWSSSALALALGTSQRTVQRALDSLEAAGKVQSFGRGRARRWVTPPVVGFTTTLLLPAPLLTD